MTACTHLRAARAPSRSLLALLVALLAVAALHASSARAKTCRALCLSGGGNRAAYEAGVVHGFVSSLPADEVAWDVVSGISAGSINTAALATFKVGDEAAAAKFLVDSIENITASDVYQAWPGGLLEGLLHEKGLLDTTPLHSFLLNKVRSGFQDRRVLVGATNLNTGSFDTWNETVGVDAFIEGCMASSAIPGVFPHITSGDSQYCDGGATYGVNIYGAVRRCLDEVTPDASDIIVDVVMCYTHSISDDTKITSSTTTIPAFLRGLEVEGYNTQTHALADAVRAFKDMGVKFRYIVSPSVKLPGKDGLDFNHTVMVDMVNIGEADAKNAVKNQVPVEEVVAQRQKRVFSSLWH